MIEQKLYEAFNVTANTERELQRIDEKLNKTFQELYTHGWSVKSVERFNFKAYDYPKHFDSIGFVIIAEHD